MNKKGKEYYGCNTVLYEPKQEEKQEDGQIRNPYLTGRCRFSRNCIDAKCDGCRRKTGLTLSVMGVGENMTTNRTERIRKELIEFANLLCETETDVNFCESARHHVYNAISELVKAHNELVDFEIARLNDLSQNVTHGKVKE